ncbi:hypothetical protein [Flavobacterium polysaccharolyticum]|uniref:Uncharacterized protein n=1 Tax=Flavobacterium polysaccharolyticum TaxID=3133148 RepID=A0ABU9NLT6_9FLAO
MKTLIPLTLLLILLSSYKTYNIFEYKDQKKLIAPEIKALESFAWTTKTTKGLPLDKDMCHKAEVLSTKFSENFSIEIDGTFVSIKGLYKRQGFQLLSKKECLLIYKESIVTPFPKNEGKFLAQLY